MNSSVLRSMWRLLGVLALMFLLNVSARSDDSAALYKSKCATCHGDDGTGNTTAGKALKVRDFHDPEVKKETDSELIEITAKGKNKMPGYSSTLKDAQIKDLVAYIHELAKK